MAQGCCVAYHDAHKEILLFPARVVNFNFHIRTVIARLVMA